MAMILDAFMRKCCTLLTDYIQEEVVMLLGVEDEIQQLLQTMVNIQCLLKDAEKRKADDSSINLWLSELKDVMYDADDVIDLCRIKGAQLLADQNSKSKTSLVCCNFSSAFSCCTNVPLRHEIGSKIKKLNNRLDQIYENRKKFKLEKSTKSKTPQNTRVDLRQTSSMVDPLVVGREVEDAANRLVDRLIVEKVEEKCRLFAVVGMGGMGKTTLAQKIFNHTNLQTYFQLKVWVCVSQTYSESELLKEVIRKAKGDYGEANTKSELIDVLRDSVASGLSLFLVLDDVWMADVWVDLLRVPLNNADTSVRVLVTTRDERVAKDIEVVYIHYVEPLSTGSCWDMLCRLIFRNEEEVQANELKDLGFQIAEKCGCLPLAIKTIANVLKNKRTRKAWEKILRNDIWSSDELCLELMALKLSIEDLPSPIRQCFLYFSLFHEDAHFVRDEFTLLWVAEGFIIEQHDSLMEDLAEEYFEELFRRSLLLPHFFTGDSYICKMHELIRSLIIFMSKEETLFVDVIVKNSTPSIKLRRLSVEGIRTATEIFDSVANPRALRTLLASRSDLLLDGGRLRRLSCLRVLDISRTQTEILPDSIGCLVHLRYLDLSYTDITAIPESINHLTHLQFLKIISCEKLTQLHSGIIQLHNLRHLDLSMTPFGFIPQGMRKLKQLNFLKGFVVANNDSSSKLEELNSLKQIRKLSIYVLEIAQIRSKILGELSYLSDLALNFTGTMLSSGTILEKNVEERLTVEKLFDELAPPPSLEKLTIEDFFGCRFPNWMALPTFERCVPHLTELDLTKISSCTQLPPLGQLPELRILSIEYATKVKKIGPEFLGCGVNSTGNSSTRIVFPKLEKLYIKQMPELEEWTFGTQVELHAYPRLKLLPCLQKLEICFCPLLKQLPKGLKHSTMKSLYIREVNSLKSIEDLPPEIEKLEIQYCESLSCVEMLDALQKLELRFREKNSLPKWLLILLQQRVLQNNTNEDFLLYLVCPEEALGGCLQGGSHWDIIQHIPKVIAYTFGPGYLRYIKQPYVYDTNL